jgi:predicted nucleotidyltransferase
MSISSLFQSLLARIEPTARDEEKFNSHKHTVSRRIEATFAISRVQLIGSYARGSAISGSSDVDLLAILRKEEIIWGNQRKLSNTVLNNMREQLQDRYNRTEVGRDGQAVVVSFDDGEYPVDVVPSAWVRAEPRLHNYPVFIIPDGAGDWIETSPEAHNRYIANEDEKSGGKLKYVAKLFKFWRACRTPNVPLNSFHVELLLAQEGICIGVKSYAQLLSSLFDLLLGRGCRALQDPLEISGLVKAANTVAKQEQALAVVAASAERAQKAVYAEALGENKEAFRLWNLIFNDQFPRS